jgi:hypothetical protein
MLLVLLNGVLFTESHPLLRQTLLLQPLLTVNKPLCLLLTLCWLLFGPILLLLTYLSHILLLLIGLLLLAFLLLLLPIICCCS